MISLHIPTTWSRLTVNRSAYMWMLRMPNLLSTHSSSTIFSGERTRTEYW